MANWCNNWVNFSGGETQIKEVKALFKAMEIKEQKTNEGQIPPFIDKPVQDWFFNIYADDTDTVSYETKYSPNTEDLIVIANHFDLNFEHTYQESCNSIFGKAIFISGNSEAKIYDLDNADFDKYEYLEDEDTYLYKGQKNDSYDEILESIFEDKFKQSY